MDNSGKMQSVLQIIYITGYLIMVVLTNKFLMNYYTTKMVDYNKFKVFGCLVFYYVPKQLRKKSSIISPLLGIFISYDDTSYTAYRIYDFYNYKIITSKVVRILRRHFSECLCTTLLSFFYSLFPFFF